MHLPVLSSKTLIDSFRDTSTLRATARQNALLKYLHFDLPVDVKTIDLSLLYFTRGKQGKLEILTIESLLSLS
jgi:hypothetical protein